MCTTVIYMTTDKTPAPRKRNTKAEYQARKARAEAKGKTYSQTRKETAVAKPTTQSAAAFQAAFDYFNKALWKGQLPQVMVTLRTFGKARGYFAAHIFADLGEMTTVHEIALDPRQFIERSEEQILSTLVHEMCHLWQLEHGHPSRGGYHNAQWGDEMKRVGLHPSDTGQPGGKETGQKVSHYIVEDGPFQVAARKLIASGKAPVAKLVDVEGFLMAAVPVPAPLVSSGAPAGPSPAPAKAGKRVKYTCPACANAVWGRSGLLVACAGSEDKGSHDPMAMLA